MDFDVLVVGSGFGGSVTALRLTEKGYRVGVLEAGARFADEDFAATSWDLKRFLFRPEAGCYGIQRIDVLKDCLILSGAGVGGGSLVYANTLYEPLPAFYDDPAWRDITDWRAELAPYYDQAKRMLGVATYPLHTPADEVMREVADQMGVGDTFRPTPVGVFFGGPGDTPSSVVPDPYFGGEGPDRNPCRNCGECMTGCRHNAKNTLVKNYLHLAEKSGATVLPLTTVTRVSPRDGGGYDVHVRHTKAKLRRRTASRVLTADQVVFAASALGTQRLLHRMKAEGHLPRLSDRLGELARTNSESILGSIAKDASVDYTQGVAITSSFHPDEHTHIEPVRYGKGSNSMSLLQTVLTDGDGDVPRWRTWLREMWTERTAGAGAVRRPALVRAHRHRPGHAEQRQLDHHVPQAQPPRPLGAHVEAGPRRAQPDLDPGRQRGRAPDGRGDGRHRRWHHRRAVQPAADRALHRRLHHRSLGRVRRDRRRTSGCTATPACTSPTAPRSPPTSASTRRSRSPPRPSARWPSGPTAARPIRARRSGRRTSASGLSRPRPLPSRRALPEPCCCRSSRSPRFTQPTRNSPLGSSLDERVRILCSLTERTCAGEGQTLSAKQGPANLPPRPGPVTWSSGARLSAALRRRVFPSLVRSQARITPLSPRRDGRGGPAGSSGGCARGLLAVLEVEEGARRPSRNHAGPGRELLPDRFGASTLVPGRPGRRGWEHRVEGGVPCPGSQVSTTSC